MDVFDEVLNVIRNHGRPRDFDSMVGVRVETNIIFVCFHRGTKADFIWLGVYIDVLHTDLATRVYGWAIGNPKRWED